MAGDWIPIEHDTPRKAEVVAIARKTNMDRRAVVGALIEFWVWVSSNSVDGRVDADVGALVDLFGLPENFWLAMESVGWLDVCESGVFVPNADMWLTNGAKSRLVKSKRQKRWRENQGEASTQASTQAPTSASTREEKRREEKRVKSKNPLTPTDSLPVDFRTDQFAEAWAKWGAHRKEKRSPLTPTTVKQQLKKLENMGHDKAIAAIENSITNGYTGLFEPDSGRSGETSARRDAKRDGQIGHVGDEAARL